MNPPAVEGQVVVEEPDTAGPPARPPRTGAAADVAWGLGIYTALGALGAVAWWLLVDPALFTKAADGGLAMGEVQLTKQFNADAWFVVIAALLGLLSGGALTWWRSRDPLLTSAILLIGSGVATGVMASVGRVLGPADPGSLGDSIGVGDRLPSQLEVSAAASYLVWPIAVLLGALFVLWSPPGDAEADQTAAGTPEPR